MILDQGDKILVVHRRLFSEDHQRFFIGTVDGYEHGVAKVTGSSWTKDPFAVALVQKKDIRTKIFALNSGTLIVYTLPASTDMKAIRCESDKDGRLILTDGETIRIDLTENVVKTGRSGK